MFFYRFDEAIHTCTIQRGDSNVDGNEYGFYLYDGGCVSKQDYSL